LRIKEKIGWHSWPRYALSFEWGGSLGLVIPFRGGWGGGEVYARMHAITGEGEEKRRVL